MNNDGPNYSNYSLDDLNEALFSIDSDRFPDRVKKIESEIEKRKTELNTKKVMENISETNELQNTNISEFPNFNFEEKILRYKNTFFLFSIFGLLVGIIIHFSAIIGINLFYKSSYFMILNFGIFVVWIPSIFQMRQNLKKERLSNPQKLSSKLIYKLMFQGKPKFVMILSKTFLIYASIYFVFYLLKTKGIVGIIDGDYVIHNHGNIVEKLTLEEYQKYRAFEISGMTSHILGFFGIAFGVLFPERDKDL